MNRLLLRRRMDVFFLIVGGRLLPSSSSLVLGEEVNPEVILYTFQGIPIWSKSSQVLCFIKKPAHLTKT
jgi:hypothetical protein